MVWNDQDWQELVHSIANGLAAYQREYAVNEAVTYLWNPSNWDRLKDTSHGRFLREVNNEIPDLLLRSRYRKEVLEESL